MSEQPESVRHAPTWIALGFLLLAISWAISTPPFSSPDEWSHYLRALSIAHGEVLGKPATEYVDPVLTVRELDWVRQAVRTVTVPLNLVPDGYACNAFNSGKPADCHGTPNAEPREVTLPNGTYQPASYLVPALLVRVAATAAPALRWGRLADALFCTLLVWLALRALAAGSPRSLIGFFIACTPMTVFLAGMLNPSGIEIFASFSLVCGLLAVARGDPAAAAHGWRAATLGAIVLPLSRSLGGAYLPVLLALWVLWTGPRAALEAARAARRRAAIFLAAAGVGFTLNRLWETLYGPKVPLDTSDLSVAIPSAFGMLATWLKQEIGNFQWLDTPLPRWVYVLWLVIALAAIGLSMLKGTNADRRAVLAATVLAVTVPVAIQVFVLRPTDWSVQGRHVLAVTVPVFLFAGDAIARRASSSQFRVMCSAALASWVLTQLSGVWVNAQRSAVGLPAPIWFLGNAQWTPPGGWLLWLTIALVATLGSAAVTAVTLLRKPAD